jgi:hypothetical protein
MINSIIATFVPGEDGLGHCGDGAYYQSSCEIEANPFGEPAEFVPARASIRAVKQRPDGLGDDRRSAYALRCKPLSREDSTTSVVVVLFADVRHRSGDIDVEGRLAVGSVDRLGIHLLGDRQGSSRRVTVGLHRDLPEPNVGRTEQQAKSRAITGTHGNGLGLTNAVNRRVFPTEGKRREGGGEVQPSEHLQTMVMVASPCAEDRRRPIADSQCMSIEARTGGGMCAYPAGESDQDRVVEFLGCLLGTFCGERS